MKALKCEMCGSNDVVKQEDLFVCQNCGTKYSVEAARKMMIEGTVEVKGTVKIDDSDEIENIYKLARRFKDADDVENALKYYSMILVKDPNSWEANFYVVYFKSISNPIEDYCKLGNPIANCLDSTLSLVQEYETDNNEQWKIVAEIYTRCTTVATMLSDRHGISNAIAGAELLYHFGILLENKFGSKYKDIIVKSWKYGIQVHNKFLFAIEDKEIHKKKMKSYVEKVKKYNPSYIPPEFNDSNSGCYIATAVYGSYNCPQVWTLRRFRDNTLDGTWYGRAFIKTYYAISPTLVKWFGHTEWFKKMWKNPLDRMVASLQRKGVESTPYKDKY